MPSAMCGFRLVVAVVTLWLMPLVPALGIVQQFVILPEERYLRRRFGADYDAYTHRVRRWL